MGGYLSDSVRLALARLRQFLQDHAFADFSDGADFADQVLSEMEQSFGSGWSTTRAVQAIDRTTSSIYEYYRLRDATVFGESSPIRLKLGGPDRVSMDFIGRLDHFYFSKFADNTRDPMRRFFVDAYFKDGAALFGRETSEEMAAFRKAGGERFKNLTDRQTKTIVQTAVARTRNWAHVGSLNQAEIKLARLVATLDARTTPLCEFLNGKLVRIDVAQETIDKLNQLPPAEFAMQLYGSELNKQIQKNPVDTIRQYLEDDGKTLSDELTRTGRSFPPFHPNCRTRMEGVIAGVDDAEQ